MKNKVDVVLNAHAHNYEEIFPTYKDLVVSGYTNPKAPAYFIIGNAGSIEGHDDDFVLGNVWSSYRNGKKLGIC